MKMHFLALHLISLSFFSPFFFSKKPWCCINWLYQCNRHTWYPLSPRFMNRSAVLICMCSINMLYKNNTLSFSLNIILPCAKFSIWSNGRCPFRDEFCLCKLEDLFVDQYQVVAFFIPNYYRDYYKILWFPEILGRYWFLTMEQLIFIP